MAQKSDQSPGAPSKPDVVSSKLAARRKLTRAGLATPVVLGTLVSKPVLGQAPYNCTISGQVSGNVSSPGNADCSVLGRSPSDWLLTTTWPANSGLVRGDLPNDQCNYTGHLVQGTLFSSTFAEAFRISETGQGNDQACSVFAYDQPGYDVATGGSATMLQVLNSASDVFDGKHLGRAIVASLLNAYEFTGTYPLTPTLVVNIFNQVRAQGYFVVNSSVPWDRRRVIEYLESLWGSIG